MHLPFDIEIPLPGTVLNLSMYNDMGVAILFAVTKDVKELKCLLSGTIV